LVRYCTFSVIVVISMFTHFVIAWTIESCMTCARINSAPALD
jgi:hypothetical protein